MKNTYRTRETRIRKKLFRMDFDDKEEDAKNAISNIEKYFRVQLVLDLHWR